MIKSRDNDVNEYKFEKKKSLILAEFTHPVSVLQLNNEGSRWNFAEKRKCCNGFGRKSRVPRDLTKIVIVHKVSSGLYLVNLLTL